MHGVTEKLLKQHMLHGKKYTIYASELLNNP